jgi:hypothetical protein
MLNTIKIINNDRRIIGIEKGRRMLKKNNEQNIKRTKKCTLNLQKNIKKKKIMKWNQILKIQKKLLK